MNVEHAHEDVDPSICMSIEGGSSHRSRGSILVHLSNARKSQKATVLGGHWLDGYCLVHQAVSLLAKYSAEETKHIDISQPPNQGDERSQRLLIKGVNLHPLN